MIYLITLLIIILAVAVLTYFISRIDDPSGDGKLGLTALTWLAGAIACIFTISLWVASTITGSWLPGIPLALFVIYIIERKIHS